MNTIAKGNESVKRGAIEKKDEGIDILKKQK
jgi:hypothetical protein